MQIWYVPLTMFDGCSVCIDISDGFQFRNTGQNHRMGIENRQSISIGKALFRIAYWFHSRRGILSNCTLIETELGFSPSCFPPQDHSLTQ